MLSSTSDLSQPLSSSSLLQDEPLGVSSTTPAPVPTPALVAAPSTTTPAATTAPLSGSTLLQRIQAQRARELQQPQPQVLPTTQQQQQPLPTTSFTNGTPAPLVIPNYAPMSQNAMGGGGGGRPSSTWFQNLFGGALQRNHYRQVPGQDSSSDALLTHYELANDDIESPLPTQQQQFQQRPTTAAAMATTGPQPYSMAGYFQTFVLDMYNLFRSFPTWAQIAIVILLIYLLWKVW